MSVELRRLDILMIAASPQTLNVDPILKFLQKPVYMLITQSS